MQLNVNAQTKAGIENYNVKSSNEPYLWMPIIHWTGKKGLHTEFGIIMKNAKPHPSI